MNQEEEEEEAQKQVDLSTVAVKAEELEELTGYKNKYLHLLADAENARKRLQKEKQEIVHYAVEGLLADFLHPLDHLENALRYTDQTTSEIRHWATGFQMILNQFKDVLANHGVSPIEAIGKTFDPHLHEAIEMVSTNEHPPGKVVEVSSRGYMLGDKTLRPARVKVSKKSDENNLSEKEE